MVEDEREVERVDRSCIHLLSIGHCRGVDLEEEDGRDSWPEFVVLDEAVRNVV